MIIRREGARLTRGSNCVASIKKTLVYWVGYSPAQMLFGRSLKDALASPPGGLGWDAATCVYEKMYGVSPCRAQG